MSFLCVGHRSHLTGGHHTQARGRRKQVACMQRWPCIVSPLQSSALTYKFTLWYPTRLGSQLALWVRIASALLIPTTQPGPLVQGPPTKAMTRPPLAGTQLSRTPTAAPTAAPVALPGLSLGDRNTSSACAHYMSACMRACVWRMKSIVWGFLNGEQRTSVCLTASLLVSVEVKDCQPRPWCRAY